jgi:hypothetical protein
MARIIGGIGSSHSPTIGFAFDRQKQNDPVWAPIFEGYKPIQEWLAEKKPDVLFIIYNDHVSSFFFDHYSNFALGIGDSYATAGLRCYKLGQSLRRAIESYPEDISVVVVGTGGLSHQVHGERTGFKNTEWDIQVTPSRSHFSDNAVAIDSAKASSASASFGNGLVFITALLLSFGPSMGPIVCKSLKDRSRMKNFLERWSKRTD